LFGTIHKPTTIAAMRSSASVSTICVVLLACGEDPAPSETQAEAGTTSTTQTSASASESGTDTGETGMEACPADTAQDLVDCVDQQRYTDDLVFIAAEREPGSPHWQAVQDLCYERFAAYGFEVDLHTYATGVNVIGRKLGTQTPEQQILVAAHYDHIPGCPGADDNATGVAGVLEAARVLSLREYPRTLIVACWDEEEDGLIGSEAYAQLATSLGDQILFNYNFEMIGFTDDAPNSQTVPSGFELLFPTQVDMLAANEYRGDFLAVVVDDVGQPYVEPLLTHAQGLGLPTVLLPVPGDLKNSPLLADLQRSDHASFWAADVPATMLTDTSEFRYGAYHCQTGDDMVEMLDLGFATKVVAATVGATAESLGL
jgi:hypothetical protein